MEHIKPCLVSFFPALGMKNNPAYANGTLLSLLEAFLFSFSFFLNQKLYLGFTVEERNHLPGGRILQAQEHHFCGASHNNSTHLTQQEQNIWL